MRASRAKRRWIRWCRYVAATQTRTNRSRGYVHCGQAKAFNDVMYAQRWAPKGVRPVWYPRWGSPK